MILFIELNFALKIQPFAEYYFVIAWLGYILVIDAVVFRLKKKSYIYNKKKKLIFLFIISAVIWWIYELINIRLGNWGYNNVYGWAALKGGVLKSVYFSTVIPAVFETAELVKAIHVFDRLKLKHPYKLTKITLYVLIALGILCLVLPLLWPKYFFPLIWLTFFLILDPVNYLHNQPSLMVHFKDRKISIILTLALAGLICGFFWEFWNYWAITKWTYNIPYVGFMKVFEMPILGYLGYIPFAWSLYAVYHYVNSLFHKNEKDII